ncbi:sulfatase-like hydrolase/transferase [Pontibacter sp. G13]|uniref:sulfatase-like hydrolase/transferase n=1 Tax=Pontibacter sp. G13 TaxID=3074898 RepID=UPI00288BB75D|nr:sulfatase-like hydrolase/transferase [Pontibacter sp. G13]WNJ19125.1 sulfatase-like hydrolase/transferase [Pontibacter sp. G13]
MNHYLNRKALTLLIFCLLAMTSLQRCQQVPPDNQPPNIIFILADDLSYRDLSIFGQEQFETPNLDALAARAVRFTQAYAGAPECAPSRGTLMTGQHLGHARIRKNTSARCGQEPLHADDPTMAKSLKSAGYATGFVGKWGMGTKGSSGEPNRQGFDLAFGYYDQLRAHTFFPHYLWKNQERIDFPGNAGFNMDRLYDANVPDPQTIHFNSYTRSGVLSPPEIAEPESLVYTEDLFNSEAIQFIDDHQDEPFFLYYASNLPHGPVIVDSLRELNDRSDYPDIRTKEWAAMVQRLDISVGKLVAKLKETGTYDNTIILFASDNGYAMCGYMGRGNRGSNWEDDPFLRNKGPFEGGKFSASEGGMRVPFFVHAPSRWKPATVSTPVWLIDLFPSMCDWGGVAERPALDGHTLTPLLTGTESFPEDRALYWALGQEEAVRQGGFMALRSSPDDPIRLYLVEEDTYTQRDLAAHYPEVVRRMDSIMATTWEDDPIWWNPHETPSEWRQKRADHRASGDTIPNAWPNGIAPRW